MNKDTLPIVRRRVSPASGSMLLVGCLASAGLAPLLVNRARMKGDVLLIDDSPLQYPVLPEYPPPKLNHKGLPFIYDDLERIAKARARRERRLHAKLDASSLCD